MMKTCGKCGLPLEIVEIDEAGNTVYLMCPVNEDGTHTEYSVTLDFFCATWTK